MKWSSVSLLAGILSILICIPVAAEMSAADIEKTVRKANVLAPNIRVSGMNKGPEVILSVYAAVSVPETDLKIDSVMLAKEFFSVDSSLTRTTVNFYDPVKPENYRSVSVRSTDVKAFGSGLVEKDELLTGLTVDQRTRPDEKQCSPEQPGSHEKQGSPEKSEKPPPAATVEDSKQSTGDRSAGNADKKDLTALVLKGLPTGLSGLPGIPRKLAPPVHAPSGYVKYSGDGFALYYPNTWRVAESESSLLTLVNGKGDEISIQKSKFQSPEEAFQEGLQLQQRYSGSGHHTRGGGQSEGHHKGHHGNWSRFGGLTPVAYPRTLRFGVEKKFPGFQLAGVYKMPSLETGSFESVFDRVVYFGWPGKVFKLRVKCLNQDAGVVNGDFEKVLSSIVVQRKQ